MKGIFLILFSAFTTLHCISQTYYPLPHDGDDHWELFWGDEFDGISVDASIWDVKDEFDHWGEPQVYLERNVSVENGILTIDINQEQYDCLNEGNPSSDGYNCWGCKTQYCWDNFVNGDPCDGTPSDCYKIINERPHHNSNNNNYFFSSGYIETKADLDLSTRYGFLEARIKYPSGNLFWANFWTYKDSEFATNPNANHCELDIAEFVGSLGQNIMTTNYWLEYDPQDQHPQVHHFPSTWDAADWHTYGIEWTPSKLIWYVDGEIIRVSPNDGAHTLVHLIIDCSIRPKKNGDDLIWPNSRLWATGGYGNLFPSKLQVDHVRVYHLREDCQNEVTYCNENFTSYNNTVKKKIRVGDGSCSNTINSSVNSLYLRATEQVLLDNSFTLPLGTELYIDVNECNGN